MKLVLLLLLFFASFFGLAQCEPNTPIKLINGRFDIENIKEVLKNSFRDYPPSELKEERKKIQICNLTISNEIKDLEENIENLSKTEKRLQNNMDVRKLEIDKSILVRRKGREKEITMEKLARLKKEGLYVVLLTNINPLTDKDLLLTEARIALEPRVLTYTNGVKVKWLSKSSNNKLIKDIVETVVAGNLIFNSVFDKKNPEEKYFIVLANPSVSFLSKNEKLLPETRKNRKSRIINLLELNDLEDNLKTNSISSDDIELLKKYHSDIVDGIKNHNDTVQVKIDRLWLDYQSEIDNLEKEIAEIEEEIKRKESVIKEICSDYKFNYDKLNSQKSANVALLKIKKEIDNLENRILQSKEKEIVLKNFNFISTPRNMEYFSKRIADFIKEMEKQVVEEYGIQIKNVSSNHQQSNSTGSRNIKQKKKLETIWIYPVRYGDGYEIEIFARFIISPIESSFSTGESDLDLGATKPSKAITDSLAIMGLKIEKNKLIGEIDYLRQKNKIALDSLESVHYKNIEVMRYELNSEIEKCKSEIESFESSVNEFERELANLRYRDYRLTDSLKTIRKNRRIAKKIALAPVLYYGFKKAEGFNLQYQFNRYYHLIDVGFRIGGVYDNSLQALGVSIGPYWKRDERWGIAWRGSYDHSFFNWFHLATDVKIGIGKDSFLAWQPRVGGIWYPDGEDEAGIYGDIGLEFNTRAGIMFTFQVGISIF